MAIGNAIGIPFKHSGINWASYCAPKDIIVDLITGGIRISWTAGCPDIDGYEIWISINGAAYVLLVTVGVGVGTYDDMTDYAGSTLDYKVRAYKGVEYSNYSNEQTISITYVAEAEALFTRMTAVGETPVTARKVILHNNIVAAKAAGLFATKYDALWLTAAHGNDSGLLNIIQDAFNLTLVDTPAFTIDRGYKGNGASDALNCNYTPATQAVLYTRNLASFGLYLRENLNELSVAMGAESSGTHGLNIAPRWGGDLYTSINSVYATVANLDSKGMWIVSRPNSTDFTIYHNGVVFYDCLTSWPSEALVNVILHILVRNIAGVLSAWSTNEIALAFVGGYMTQTEVTAFQTIFVDGYLQSIGAKV